MVNIMEVFNVVLTPENVFIKDHRTKRVVEQSLKEVPPSILYSIQLGLERAILLKSPFKPTYVIRDIKTESGSSLDRWVKRKS